MIRKYAFRGALKEDFFCLNPHPYKFIQSPVLISVYIYINGNSYYFIKFNL
jgi:hypothetical protein